MNDTTLREIPLDADLLHQANYNSFGGKRGDICNASYQATAAEILGWPIADSKKEKLLAELHRRYSSLLSYEARHVSVAVAGPARYNAKKLDHGDKILQIGAEIAEWFDGVRKQVEAATKEDDKREQLLKVIDFLDSRPELDPTGRLAELATVDNAKFIELFEAMVGKYRWRKNSLIYKLYTASKAGEVKEVRKEVVFEDDNLTAYKLGDRYYIKFVTRAKRQLHVALKSRGWWWNAYEEAYSTYLDRFDPEWVQGISTNYAKYI